jgi:pyruvate/2-oxoglutarate dehydrogenase complex dihydrolipoamide acyltransferase (E2) component
MAKPKQEIIISKEAANDDGATIVKVYVPDRSPVHKGSPIIDLETSKAVYTIEAQQDGFVRFFCKEGDDLPIGALVATIHASVEDCDGQVRNFPGTKDEMAATGPRFSKQALEVISRCAIPMEAFNGLDFVTKADAERIAGISTSGSFGQQERISDDVKIEKLSRAKRSEIESLTSVNTLGLPSTLTISVNTHPIESAVQCFPGVLQGSLLPVIIYETSRLLRKYPELNSYYHQGSIGLYASVHIGVALDIGLGLKVVTLSHSDQKSIQEIAKELLGAIDKYTAKRLTADDITGSTFTITDLSAVNIGAFTPLINKGQSAILGISVIDRESHKSILSFTFDHRVANGREAGMFLNELKSILESYGPSGGENLPIPEIHCCRCMATMAESEQTNRLGFIKIVNYAGQEEFICQTCLLLS